MTDQNPNGNPELEAVWAEARDLVRKLEGSSVERLVVAARDTRIEIQRASPRAPPPGARPPPPPPRAPPPPPPRRWETTSRRPRPPAPASRRPRARRRARSRRSPT